MFIGFAGEGYKREEQVLLNPGQQVEVAGFAARHKEVKVTDDGQKQMVTAHVGITRDGKPLDDMHPAKWYFRKHEDQPTTEVAIRRGFWEDLYIVLAAFDLQTQSATLHVVVNPLVNWIWFGFGILALGTLIALLPESSFAFASARAQAEKVAGPYAGGEIGR
jgi:cytochrome c-type biogenesis protein CcmF